MRYHELEIIEFKKKHACGNNNWQIIRLGASIKLECLGCKRQISLLPSEIDRRKKPKQT